MARSNRRFSSNGRSPSREAVRNVSFSGLDALLSPRIVPPGPMFSGRANLRLYVPPIVNRPLKSQRAFSYLSPSLGFRVPRRALVCVRRKQRREVLFAKRSLRGRGSRVRTQDSSLRC